MRENTGIFLTWFLSLIRFLPTDPTSSTLPQELGQFSASLKDLYFVQRGL